MNRCVICDYTEEEGSALLNKSPSRNNKVHSHATEGSSHGDEHLCDECASEIDTNYADLAELDDEVQGS